MNGVELGILTHHNYLPEPYHANDRHGKSPAVRHGYLFLEDEGMIREFASGGRSSIRHWELTEKGRFHVEAMLNLPLPVEKTIWIHEPRS